MIEITQAVAGTDRMIYVVEDYGEVTEFLAWIGHQDIVAVDTETTGLDLFSDKFRVRLVQFGNETEAWVIPVELGEEFAVVVADALLDLPRLVFQNAAYDVIALQQGLGITVDWDKVRDTEILAHLVDPRELKEGGTGHSLSDLTRALIDPEVADDIKDSMKHMAAEAGVTQGEVFKTIDLWNDVYLTYAGMDAILTMSLFAKLAERIPGVSARLVETEHKIARICAAMETTGFLLDVDYAEQFSEELLADEQYYEAVALLEYGTESVNATAQVAADLIESGVKLTERTPSGAWKLDKTVLEPLAEQGHPLAVAVMAAKRAKKWRTTWVQKFLDNRDSQDRCHASIQPLRARTARMSITGIPAQTLPAGDWKVRRCFVADPGHSIVSIDYKAQELRVLAALSGDQNMIDAFATGADLHQMTADASGVPRSVGKTVNFAYVYGSGPKNIAETCGITVAKAREVIKGFESTYPAVKRLSDKLQRTATQRGYIETPSGRRIPVDKERPYAALNYCLSPDTKILTADLRHVDAETVKVGDQLVGFDEYAQDGPHRKFRVANVEAVSEVWKESVIVKTSDGKETICSTDHKWLVRKPYQQPRYVWVDASELTQTDEFLSMGTWEEGNTWGAGYVSGLFDGEGCLSSRCGGQKQTSFVFSQVPGPVMDRFQDEMDKCELTYSYYKRAPNSTSPTDTVSIQGVTRIMKTLGVLRPARFMPRATQVYDGAAIIGGKQFDTPHIVSVTPIGMQKLVSITTSTKTLIANGYLSHNCIQSTSRDITAAALIRLDEAGYTPYLRLPIHDEVLACVPSESATAVAQEIADLMKTNYSGVLIDTDCDVAGNSWGELYMEEH